MMNIRNVISVFDGISCGQIALNRAGVHYEEYYASELEKEAIECTQRNYPFTVQIGDVRNVKAKDYKNVDLFIGGSPCQGFSFIGKQLNFEDPRSKLFFEYARILEEIRQQNPNVKFLMENVRMKQETKDIISNYLGVEPVEINSKLIGRQSRTRNYWTNIDFDTSIPELGLTCAEIIDYEDQTPNSENWQNWFEKKGSYQLKKQFSAVINDREKAITLTARHVANWNGNLVRTKSGLLRYINRKEAEKLQTLPVGYTKEMELIKAYKAIGNGWHVDTLAHIFKGLNNE